MLARLAADRSEMMASLRRRLSAPGALMPPDGIDALFRITSLFERAVWLIRRCALLLPGAEGDAEDVPEAAEGAVA